MPRLSKAREALSHPVSGTVTWGLLIVLIGACSPESPEPLPVPVLETTRLESQVISSPEIRWPDFFLVGSSHRYLWGERGQIYEVDTSGNTATVAHAEERSLTLGLDRPIGAMRTWSETLAILDSSGQISLREGRTRQTHSFSTELENRAAALTLARNYAYVLQHGDLESSTAVVAYTFEGDEVNRWGQMTPDGILQSRLKGGGITACPDGSVYYSYINSPRILRLLENGSSGVAPVGAAHEGFRALPAREVRAAHREVQRTHSVAALVELGLSGSRVMSLFCSPDGLLLRQVAQPDRSGSQVELWSPATDRLLGRISVGASTLLAVGDHTLFLGSLTENRDFRLERIRYRVKPGPAKTPRRSGKGGA